MKNLYSTILLVCCAFLSWTQQITGKIFDAYTNTPIEGAVLTTDKGTSFVSNENGKFNIPCENAGVFSITHISYEGWEGQLNCSNDFQIGLKPSTLNLNAVEITAAQNENSQLLEQPISISHLSRRDLTRNTGIFLEQTINLEPGVRMEKRTTSGGQRFTIRGYGNNTNFNGMGYKAYLNGIPLTDASGVTILDDVDFGTLGKVEVIKGPASSLYGTGIAGVVNMYTMRPTPQQTSVSQEVMVGSYGLFRSNTRLETASDKASIMVNYGKQSFDSFRPFSNSEKDYVSFVGDFRPNEKQLFTTYFSYSDSYEQLAGQIDSATFFNREDVANDRYVANNARVEIESFRAGMSHRYEFSEHISNMTSGFVSGYGQDQAFAVGLNNNAVLNFGGRSEFRLNFGGEKVQFKGVVGGEYQKTSGLFRSYSMMNGVMGGLRSDNDIETAQTSLFSQWNIMLPANFKVTLGASSNFIEYDVIDRLAHADNPDHEDASGRKVFDPVIAPRVAIQKMVNKHISAYVSVSQGYSPPTTSDIVIPFTGAVNSDLVPEFGTQVEVGSKGSLLSDKLSYQIALFQLQVDDKLTSRSVADTDGTILYTYSVNAGNQVNNGVELALSYTAINNQEKAISFVRPFLTFTYSDFSYDSFVEDVNSDLGARDFSGNTVIGVPPLLLNMGVDLETKWGLYLNTSYQYVDEMYITFDNEHQAPSFDLLNAKAGYRTKLGSHFNLDAYFGGNNLTNSLFYDMVFLNWERGPQPAIYLPGAYTPTFFGGVNLSYVF